MPEDTPTVATEVLLLIHVPPAVASLNVVDDPIHTDVVPVMAAGSGLTVTTLVTKQPTPTV